VIVAVTVEMVVAVAVIVVVKICIHLYFRLVGQGNDRWLYPPSGWSLRTRGVLGL
jgi:hypothetical protein